MAALIINMKMKYNVVSPIFLLIKCTLIIWVVVLRIKTNKQTNKKLGLWNPETFIRAFSVDDIYSRYFKKMYQGSHSQDHFILWQGLNSCHR